MDISATKRGFDSKATWVIDVLGICFDMLSMGVYNTSQYQTSGRLVQELTVCTVGHVYCCLVVRTPLSQIG